MRDKNYFYRERKDRGNLRHKRMRIEKGWKMEEGENVKCEN